MKIVSIYLIKKIFIYMQLCFYWALPGKLVKEEHILSNDCLPFKKLYGIIKLT